MENLKLKCTNQGTNGKLFEERLCKEVLPCVLSTRALHVYCAFHRAPTPPPPQPPHHHLLVSDFVRLLSSSLVHTSIPFPKCSIIFSTSYIPWFFSSCVRFLLLFPTWFSYSLSLRIFRVFFVHCFPNQRWHSPCDYLFIHSFFPPCRVKFITRVCVKAQTIL